MKDHVSIRVTFSQKGEASALEIMQFIEENFQYIKFGTPKEGNNPRYQPGGDRYNPDQGEFKLSYTRCNVKNKEPRLPVRVEV